MVDYIAAVGAAAEAAAATATKNADTVTTGAGNYFGDWLTQQISMVNQQITTADMDVRRLALGEGNVHEVMMRLETAKLSFELAVQVRNKLLDAYQDILRMQI
jgi:flagellar hook-basal body complex protein FliE